MSSPRSGLVSAALLAAGLALGPGIAQAQTCTISPAAPAVAPNGTITWSATQTGLTGTLRYSWSFNGGNPSPSSSSAASPTVTYRAAGASTTSLQLRGNNGRRANCSRSFTVDGTAPTAPADLSATAASTTQINLTWTASTDNVGVTGYRVERCTGASCTNFAQIATTTTTSFNNTGLTANTTYRYRVRANDAAGNLSTYSNIASATTGAGGAPNVSINSTSRDSTSPVTSVVPQQTQVPNNTSNFSIVAINDLGMHCGDLDTRIASILPPFQVLLGQVIQKGSEPVLNPTGISLQYSAVSNGGDPVLSQAGVLTGLRTGAAAGNTYKTNFWETVAKGAYDPFYPGGLGITPLATGGFPTTTDIGLPVPNVENLYIGADGRVNSGDETLTAVQHAMPGLSQAYVANAPQLVEEFYTNKPFFVNFPFGYVANDVNWHEGAGVPFAAWDDFGRQNAYPLVRVQAKNDATGAIVATVDTVLPISGEASCVNCHGAAADAPNSPNAGVATTRLANASLPVASSVSDPDSTMPDNVSAEYGADINILRLHDVKHGSKYVSYCSTAPCPADPCTGITQATPNGSPSCLVNKALVQNKPVVCQVCHYTPALDLAQVGPKAGAPGTEGNGRNQIAHQSNSRVMHYHHGTLGTAGFPGLFPQIPSPIQDANGNITNQPQRLTALEDSCYQCHPGTNTKCLRGAMFNGGMLCNDCHGSMVQVGNDFTGPVIDVRTGNPVPGSLPVSPTNPGDFKFLPGGNFYNPASNQPRTPWANEPGCGSCHTGDASSNLANTTGVIRNVRDIYGNTDNIRLLQAWRTADIKATPIVPTNKKFAEPAVPATFVQPGADFPNPGAGNPKLYRVSTGHGGVMCEGCHGATHAEFPNSNPAANDNVMSIQLQGHTGTIIECSTCHGTAMNSRNTMDGPHGIHPVGANTSFADGGHEDAINGNNCVVCHGPNATEDGRRNNVGTVLSRAAATRNFNGLEDGGTVNKGQPVGCNSCHR